MNTGNNNKTANESPLAQSLEVKADRLVVSLEDGRIVSVPLSFYPTLEKASKEQRNNFETIGDGVGFHWPDLDVDLSTVGLVAGRREGIPRPPVIEGASQARRHRQPKGIDRSTKQVNGKETWRTPKVAAPAKKPRRSKEPK